MRYEFDGFVLDTDRVELTSGDRRIALEPKSFDLLVFLVENRGRVVPKDEIFDAVWPGVFVSEASISSAIKQIRHALGDDGASQRFVRTVRGKGFHFVAEPRNNQAAGPAAAPDVAPPSDTIVKKKPTIAVRPFRLALGDPSLSAITEAFPAELITALSRLRWLTVIARASSFQFGNHAGTHDEMGAKLGAQYVVSGTVELNGRDIVVFVELCDAQTAEIVWANRFSGKLDDIFELRTKIALELTTALELRVPLHEASKLDRTPSEYLDAWDHFHLGVRHMFRYNKSDNALAADHFGKALEIDPSFARASSGLSYTEFQSAFQHFGSDASQHRKLAESYAERAMSLDPLDPFCNLNYGRVKWLLGDPESALIWVNNAVTANPNYAFGYFNRATLFNALSQGADADENAAISLKLSPLDPHLQSMFGIRAFAALLTDDFAQATHYAERAMSAPNPHLYVYTIAALAFSGAGAKDRARGCIDTIKSRDVSFGRAEFLSHYAVRGDPTHRQKIDAALSDLGL